MSVKGQDAGGADLEQLGDFRVIRSLGRGGMAHVYLAEQLSLKRMVALKVLLPEATSGEQQVLVERFQREAKAGAGLNHPNIVQVYAVGEEHGVHYIAQEYVRGMNLKDYLVRNGPPSIPVCLQLMRQAVSALLLASDAGILHRDIKPGNLLVTRKRTLKVADFGLARLIKSTDDVHLTQSGTTMGTPLYMSPEQLNGQSLDVRSDTYSLGVTFFHLLVGRPPFEGPTAMSIAVQHLREEPPSLQEIRPDVPAELESIVHRMMEKECDQRFQSLKDVQRELKQLSQEFSQTVSVPNQPVLKLTEEESPASNDSMPAWLNELLTLVGAAVVVCGLGYLVGRFFRPEWP